MKWLCPYKDVLGKVGEGVHSYRILDIAIFDVLVTIGIAWIIHRFFFPKISFYLVLATFFGIGILLHRIFCVRTTIDKLLFKT